MSYKNKDVILLDCPTKALANNILECDANEIFIKAVYNSAYGGEPSYIYSDFDGPGKYKAYAPFTAYDKIMETSEEDEKEEEDDVVMLEFNGKKYPVPAKSVKQNKDGSIDLSEAAFKTLPKKVQKELSENIELVGDED